MFFQILNKVTKDCQASHRPYLINAIDLWCKELQISQDITDYILTGYEQHEINDLTNYIYEEWKPKIKEELLGLKKSYDLSKLYRIVNQRIFYQTIFNPNNIRSETVKFIVLIAFGITAIGYCIYILNHPKQQQTARRKEPGQSNPDPLATSVYTVQTSPVQTITKQFLVLVVSALQADFIKSLAAKRRINSNEGESLYEITKYLCLWLGSETDFNQKKANINQYYEVPKGEESEEYDIYLVYLELNQADEGFKPNVNQLDRYDAFRNLADLEIEFEISPRLQMEAYEKFEVYSR